jgi:hypothetical protein
MSAGARMQREGAGMQRGGAGMQRGGAGRSPQGSTLLPAISGLLRFDSEHVVLRRDGALFAQQAQAVASVVQKRSGLRHVLWNKADLGEKTEDEGLRLADPRVCGPEVPTQTLKVAPPGKRVGAVAVWDCYDFEVRETRGGTYSLSPYAMKSKCSLTSKPACEK